MGAFYTGYTNLLLGYQAGDAAVSNNVTTRLGSYLKKDGTVAMTGNLNMGGYSITNIAAASLKFAGGAEISAAKVATWDAGSLSDTAVSNLVAARVAKAGDLTQFTALGGTSGQVFKSNGAGGGAWAADSTSASTPTIVQAFGGTDQLITYSGTGVSWDTITWSESIDTGSCFASDTFTAPSDGYYRILVCVPARMVEGVNEATTATVGILKNGTTAVLSAVDQFKIYTGTYIYRIRGQISLSCVVSLSSGDTIQIQARKNGTNWYVDYDAASGQVVKASLTIEKL
jgi:hypothetical protein